MQELLKLKQKEIIITKDFSIRLKEQTLFKANGGEGLHLWEASVVLSRYSVKNKDIFENKNIIELGTGCGLLGISLLMKTKCNYLTFSDYQDSVIDNLKDNINLNSIKNNNKYNILKLDWRDYKTINDKYDIVIGSELIYQGGFIEELVKLINKILKDDGVCLISMPEERSMTKQFLKYIEENGLKWKSEYYKDDDLFIPVLKDEKESKKLFENLKEMKLMLYTITKVII